MKDLKYFKLGKTDRRYGPIGLVLDEKVFSLLKINNHIQIREECDGYYFEEFTKEQAIELFQEAINWIKNDL